MRHVTEEQRWRPASGRIHHILFMETGHHKVEDVCNWIANSGKHIGQLIFTHHGRAVLENPDRELSKATAILGDRVSLAYDGMVLHL